MVTANGGGGGSWGSQNSNGTDGSAGFGTGASVMLANVVANAAIKTNGNTSPIVWNDTDSLAAGTPGRGEQANQSYPIHQSNSQGGVGGVVIVEWA